jgi:hypothetical protein
MEFISFSKEGSLNTDEVLKVFKESTNLEEIKGAVQKAKERLFVSFDTVQTIDRQKEELPVDNQLMDTYKTYMNRGGILLDLHSNTQLGKTLDYKSFNHPDNNLPGVLTINKVYDDYPYDNEMWNKMQRGEIKGVSVGGKVDHKEISKDGLGGLYRKLKGFCMGEKSLVHGSRVPCNPLATIPAFSLIAKSDFENIEELGKELGIDWDKTDKKEFEMGMKVELEHEDITGGDLVMTGKIALAHLKEIPDYYTRLKQMEEGVKKEIEEESKMIKMLLERMDRIEKFLE